MRQSSAVLQSCFNTKTVIVCLFSVLIGEVSFLGSNSCTAKSYKSAKLILLPRV